MDNNITDMDGLAARIKKLEAAEKNQLELVKMQLAVVKSELTPTALIKNSFHAITGSKKLQHSAIDTSTGVAAGWLTRKLFTLNSKSFTRKMLGYGLQFITTNFITKKLPELREKAEDRKQNI